MACSSISCIWTTEYLLIACPDMDTHLEHLRQVFLLLSANGIAVNPQKCVFGALLTNRVLREVAPSISQSLTDIFNLSLQSSTFPQDWKTGVVPLYKQRGDASAPTNYRPVSLLPAVAKVVDAIQSKGSPHF